MDDKIAKEILEELKNIRQALENLTDIVRSV